VQHTLHATTVLVLDCRLSTAESSCVSTNDERRYDQTYRLKLLLTAMSMNPMRPSGGNQPTLMTVILKPQHTTLLLMKETSVLHARTEVGWYPKFRASRAHGGHATTAFSAYCSLQAFQGMAGTKCDVTPRSVHRPGSRLIR
jgi:hypothetical protein